MRSLSALKSALKFTLAAAVVTGALAIGGAQPAKADWWQHGGYSWHPGFVVRFGAPGYRYCGPRPYWYGPRPYYYAPGAYYGPRPWYRPYYYGPRGYYRGPVFPFGIIVR